MRARALYPIYLDLRGRNCIVVGGGRVAERKVRGLVATGATVTVVAKMATPGIARLAGKNIVNLFRRRFRASDLKGKFIALCATDDPAVNARVASEAAAKGVMANVADSPAHCDFYLPSVVRRGRLQIAISTGGASPALAARIGKELSMRYGSEYAELLRMATGLRPRVAHRVPQAKRAGVFHAMASPAMVRLLRAGKKAAVRRAMEEIVEKAINGKQ
ncbi:MAG: bifunctional precorrin-2 dehydrogenase/sirohydrochlorin ferrochelatase [Candidatus Aureabacteria bacterium]|nr:bifunctional precorrin-2 dehydrogenase/sirohydrochlorin ferrochelatase [Candidatus Auribacterota bacterium]